MNRFFRFYQATVGKKVFMAVTGAVWFLYLVAHLTGNLLVFAGPKAMNEYGYFLKNSIPEILWPFRIVLAVALLTHIVASIQVTIVSWRARPVGYVMRRNVETNFAARTMIIGGPLILAFLIYHLLMFTFLTTGPGYSAHDIYRNVVLAFRVPAISIAYIAAMAVLGLHLYHGIWSMFQTLGAEMKRSRIWLAWLVSIAIAGGFILVPIAVMAGIVGGGVAWN
jgi:succinate dehydrogenase / fumarate reductase, cytochrome b subunit